MDAAVYDSTSTTCVSAAPSTSSSSSSFLGMQVSIVMHDQQPDKFVQLVARAAHPQPPAVRALPRPVVCLFMRLDSLTLSANISRFLNTP